MKENTTGSNHSYTSVLRVISGQENEPEFVLVEHSYARSWNWIPGANGSHPRKTLFINSLPKKIESENDEIDVVDVDPLPALPYDPTKGKRLMNECAWHISPKGSNAEDFSVEETEDEDWVEKVERTEWTAAQSSLFERVVKILDDDKLGRLAMKNVYNEPVKRRAHLDKIAARFRHSLGRINWDVKLTHWLHLLLIQKMSKAYLASYLDILQTLRAKIPTLIDKMMALSSIEKDSTIDALNLLLKRPWDPALPSLNQCKPQRLEGHPIVIQIPNGPKSPSVPQVSRRARFFNAQLQFLFKCIPIYITSEANNASNILESIVSKVRSKIAECKIHYPGQPIVLLGWGIGAVLASIISSFEKVSATICLGFPMNSSIGRRGEADDPILECKTPSLFIIGDKSTDCTVDDLEDMRHRMQTETSLVVVSDTDNLLRMSWEKRYSAGLTQSMVDRCIVDEIGEFFKFVLNDDYPSNASMAHTHSASFANPLPPKTFRRIESTHKRKLCASEAPSAPPSKVFRAGTNLSQTLGLKIPVSVSSYSSSQQSNGKGQATHSISEEESQISSDSSNSSHVLISGMQGSSEVLKNTKGAQNEFVGLADVTLQADNAPTTLEASNLKQPFLGASGVATIALGSIASISQQKYQRMIEGSDSRVTFEESASKMITSQANRFTLSSDIGSEVSVVDDGAVSKPKSLARRSTDSSQILVTSSLMTPKTSSALSNFGKNMNLASSLTSVAITPVSSSPDPTITKWHKRGRPPSSKRHSGLGRGMSQNSGTTGSTRGRGRGHLYSKGTALNGGKRNEGMASRVAAAVPRSSGGDTSMTVFTLTGSGGEGNSVELSAEGISSLGRGFITLAKGGSSTVRVFSANSPKLTSSSISTDSSTNSRTAIKGSPSPSFVLTNITSHASQSPASSSGTGVVSKSGNSSVLNIGNLVLAGKRERVINTDSKLRPVLAHGKKSVMAPTLATLTSVSQSSLNIQGISASRSITSSKVIPTTRTLGSIKPTMMILSTTSDSNSSGSIVSGSRVSLAHSSLDSSSSTYAIDESLETCQNTGKDFSSKQEDLSLTFPSEFEFLSKIDDGTNSSSDPSKESFISVDVNAERPSEDVDVGSVSSESAVKFGIKVSSPKLLQAIKEDVSANILEDNKSSFQTSSPRIHRLGINASTQVILSATNKVSTSSIRTVVIPPNSKNKAHPSTPIVSGSSPISTLRLIKSISPRTSAISSAIITKTFSINTGNLAAGKAGIRRISLDDLKLKDKQSSKLATFNTLSGKELDNVSSVISSESLTDCQALASKESSAVVTVSNSVQTPIVTSRESKNEQGETSSANILNEIVEEDSFEIDVEALHDSSVEVISSDSDVTVLSSKSSLSSGTKRTPFASKIKIPSTSLKASLQKIFHCKKGDDDSSLRVTRSSSKSPMKLASRRNLRSSL